MKNADAPTCDEAPKCHWCADSFFCSNTACVEEAVVERVEEVEVEAEQARMTWGNSTGIDYWIVKNSWGPLSPPSTSFSLSLSLSLARARSLSFLLVL